MKSKTLIHQKNTKFLTITLNYLRTVLKSLVNHGSLQNLVTLSAGNVHHLADNSAGSLGSKTFTIQFIKPTVHALQYEYSRHAICRMFRHFLIAIVRESLCLLPLSLSNWSVN